jgi:DNA-binding transcriptional MerR regulator
MSKPRKAGSSVGPVHEPDPDAVYTLDVVVRLTGVSSQTILRYQEQGLIAPVARGTRGIRRFDDEALRTLRRIEHLRTRYEMNLRALKLTLGLLREMERLRDDLRRSRRV